MPFDQSALAPHQRRVVEEKAELDAKLNALSIFVLGPSFQAVAPDEQDRLRRQAVVMRQYSSILRERIAAF